MQSMLKRFRKIEQVIRFKATEKVSDPSRLTILSIDGGGFRNIISLVILLEIETRCKRSLSSMFDIFGGASTSSIIAAALNMPTWLNPIKPKYTSKDILKLFESYSRVIFSNDNFNSKQYKYDRLFQFFDQHLNGDKPKYNGINRDKIFEKIFQLRQIENSIRQLLIPTFDYNQDLTLWFDSKLKYKDSKSPNRRKESQKSKGKYQQVTKRSIDLVKLKM